MLELFFKHLDFVAPALTERGYQDHEKYIYKFDFEVVNKHWLSFYATYMRGRKSAFDDLGCGLCRIWGNVYEKYSN